MIEIPKQLQNKEFRFIKVAKQDKRPIEKDWTNTKNYLFDNQELIEHLNRGGNYGVISTFGDLIIIDCDDPILEKELSNLPETFTIRTGGGGLHAYYLSNLSEKLVLKNPLTIETNKKGNQDFKHLGEIQSNKAMVVGPGSIHKTGNKYKIIKDLPIAKVTKEEILEVFGKYSETKMKKSKTLFEDSNLEIFQDPIVKSIKNKIKIKDLMKEQGYDLKKNPTECLLGHSSEGKKNFSYNNKNGLWHCFNCGKGGDIFDFIMEHKKIDFIEAKEFLNKKLFTDLKNHLEFYGNIKSEKKDKLFSEFESLFRISRRESYLPAIKALFYSLQGHALKENIIEIGTMQEDLRSSFVLSLRSGGRKQGFIDVIKETSERMEWSYSNITSLHEEQLVGKSNYNKKKGISEIYKGYLNDEILVLNDSVTLINHPKFELSRNYLMQSQDTLGKNFVTKKLTEQSKEHALRYRANSSCFFFIQPVPIMYENINTGWERRFPFIQIDISDYEREMAANERFSEKFTPNWDPWIKHLKQISEKVFVWNLTKEAQNKINEFTSILANYFKEIQGVRGDKDFGENRRFKFSDDLTTYAIINSVIEDSEEVTERHVILAFQDYASIAEASFTHFLSYVKSYSKNTRQPVQKKIIDFLRENNCTSEKSSNLTISDFKNELVNLTGKSSSTIEYHYKRLRDEGIISSKQIYQGDTKVWLNIERI